MMTKVKDTWGNFFCATHLKDWVYCGRDWQITRTKRKQQKIISRRSQTSARRLQGLCVPSGFGASKRSSRG